MTSRPEIERPASRTFGLATSPLRQTLHGLGRTHAFRLSSLADAAVGRSPTVVKRSFDSSKPDEAPHDQQSSRQLRLPPDVIRAIRDQLASGAAVDIQADELQIEKQELVSLPIVLYGCEYDVEYSALGGTYSVPASENPTDRKRVETQVSPVSRKSKGALEIRQCGLKHDYVATRQQLGADEISLTQSGEIVAADQISSLITRDHVDAEAKHRASELIAATIRATLDKEFEVLDKLAWSGPVSMKATELWATFWSIEFRGADISGKAIVNYQNSGIIFMNVERASTASVGSLLLNGLVSTIAFVISIAAFGVLYHFAIAALGSK